MELSIKTGLSQSAIAKWELNKTEPTASALITLSKFFGEPVDYLLCLIDWILILWFDKKELCNKSKVLF